MTEISKEQFGLWKHEPVTKWFFDYLINKRAFLKSAALENWLGGSQSFADINQTVRGQIIELEEMTDLPFEAIEEFYKEREEIHGDDRVNHKAADEDYSKRPKTTSSSGY